MVFLTKLTKSESEIEMKKSKWTVVTIQEEDGHEFDGIFITNSEKALGKFARALSPLSICCSRHESEKAARDFYFEICDGYINIDPYIFQKSLPKNIS